MVLDHILMIKDYYMIEEDVIMVMDHILKIKDYYEIVVD